MATVNTQQSPDLLSSLLVGMGSSSSLPAAEAVATPQFGFAELLDPIAEPENLFPEMALPEEELPSEFGSDGLSMDGQLNALLAAALGAGRSPADLASNASVSATEKSEGVGSTDLQAVATPGEVQTTIKGSPKEGLSSGNLQVVATPGDAQTAIKGSPTEDLSSGNLQAVATPGDAQTAIKGSPTEGLSSAISEGEETGRLSTSIANTIQKTARGGEQENSSSNLGANPLGAASDEAESIVEPTAPSVNSKVEIKGTQAGEGTTADPSLSQGEWAKANSIEQPRELISETSERRPIVDLDEKSDSEMVGNEPESVQIGSAQTAAISRGPSSDKGKAANRNSELRSRGELQGEDLGAGFSSNATVDSAHAVTAMSAGGTLQREGGFQHSFKQELVETATNRPATKLSPDMPLPSGWNSPELNDIQASFDTALQQAAETFPLESVAQQISEAAEPDSGWISLEIQPPELGKLEIIVNKQGDDYSARIIAHEASTGEALQLQQADLIEALGKHGLELKEVQITTDSGAGGNSSPDNSQRDFGGRQGKENAERQARESQRENFLNSRAKAMNGSSSKSSLAENVQVNLLV